MKLNITQKKDLLQSFNDDFDKFSDFIDRIEDDEEVEYLRDQIEDMRVALQDILELSSGFD